MKPTFKKMTKKIIEQYYDKLAPVYDRTTRGQKWIAPIEIAKRLLPFVRKGNIVLDLGCGTGQSAAPLIRKGCKVIGIDISSEMLKLAKKRYRFWKLYKYDIEKGLKGLGFKKGYFDAVIAVGILEFVKNFKKIIKELSEITKPGGYVAFTYELLLQNRKFQSERISSLGEGLLKPVPELLSFKISRYRYEEIKRILHKNGIKGIYNEKFIGYLRSKQKIPIHYGLIIGKKICD